jgi:hypothetical protein
MLVCGKNAIPFSRSTAIRREIGIDGIEAGLLFDDREDGDEHKPDHGCTDDSQPIIPRSQAAGDDQVEQERLDRKIKKPFQAGDKGRLRKQEGEEACDDPPEQRFQEREFTNLEMLSAKPHQENTD